MKKKFVCKECPYTLEQDDYCNIKQEHILPEKTRMCKEGVEEKLRKAQIKHDKFKNEPEKQKVITKKMIPLQKYLLKLTEHDLEKQEEDIDKEPFKEIPLADISKAKYNDKHIKVKCVLMGKRHAPYLIPKVIEISCKNPKYNSDKCAVCPLSGKKKKYKMTFNDNKEDILDMIDINSNQLMGAVRKKIGILCQRARVDIIEKQNIEELQIIPELQSEMIDFEYTIKRALYIGEGLKTNISYIMEGTTLPDPKNQLAVFLVKRAKVIEDDIGDFQVTEDIKKKLEKFQLQENQSIKDKLSEIYEDFTYNVEPRIFGRKNLHLSLDLVYHSPLAFTFLDQVVYKGWGELLIIGDTRCGKTALIKKMVRHYHAGEFITSGENTTFAGLVGGAMQSGQNWMLSWGKWILNNKRLMVIDEADGVDNELLSKLSGLRSSGIAEIVKMGSREKTMAKTRIIWITNPKKGNMQRYSYGIEAVKELWTKLQDISRLDFVVGVAKDDVPIELINKRHHKTSIRHRYKSEYCHLLVMFAWSRRPEQIKFESDAEDLILKESINMDEEYSYLIPIVTGAEMREKLAKMSTSLAIRLYNVDETGKNVIVTKKIAQFIINFLRQEYARPCLDYQGFSEQKGSEKEIKNKKELSDMVEWDMDKVVLFLNQNRLNIGDVQDILNCQTKADAKHYVTYLIKQRALIKSNTQYLKTPAFIQWLKEQKKVLSEIDDEEILI